MSSERRPAILAVDDEPAVLAAVARDLRRGFGERFRILRAGSGAEALTVLGELRTRGDQVAMLIADQRMPGMPGTEYLVKARTVVPDAKRVLLTAYADTEAAISAINEVALDYYLLKPWDPPEEELFPVVEDLLTTWEAGAALEAGGVRIIGHRFSKDSHDLRDFLARNRVPARWLDVERDGEARELLQVAGVAPDRLPVALLEDGAVLERPTVLELAERLGVTSSPAQDHYDLVIVGGGPAGLAAAVYGASEGLRTVMVEREAPGGQAGQSSKIENYLGFPAGLSGSDLARRATDQARRLGAELLTVQDAVALRIEGAGRLVELSGGGTLSANCVLVASGVSYRQHEAPGFSELTGAGVYYGAAMTEARSCADQHVVIIGGANSAGQAAVHFSGYAGQVTMLVRSSLEKSMSHYLVEQLAKRPNVDIRSGFWQACWSSCAIRKPVYVPLVLLSFGNWGDFPSFASVRSRSAPSRPTRIGPRPVRLVCAAGTRTVAWISATRSWRCSTMRTSSRIAWSWVSGADPSGIWSRSAASLTRKVIRFAQRVLGADGSRVQGHLTLLPGTPCPSSPTGTVTLLYA